jgi:hypothetical protein
VERKTLGAAVAANLAVSLCVSVLGLRAAVDLTRGGVTLPGAFHTVGWLTLLPKSQLQADFADAISFDVIGNATPESAPAGSINRGRQQGEVASRIALAEGRQKRNIVRWRGIALGDA